MAYREDGLSREQHAMMLNVKNKRSLFQNTKAVKRQSKAKRYLGSIGKSNMSDKPIVPEAARDLYLVVSKFFDKFIFHGTRCVAFYKCR